MCNFFYQWLFQGIEIFVIGIRGFYLDPEELNAIASNPDSSHVFMLDSWQEALDRLAGITRVVCPPPPNTEGKDIVFMEHNVLSSISRHIVGHPSPIQLTFHYFILKVLIPFYF